MSLQLWRQRFKLAARSLVKWCASSPNCATDPVVADLEQWLSSLRELSLSLAAPEQPLGSIMCHALQIVQERLHAETTALFLWENGRLRRKYALGVPNDWYVEESYEAGEGLTGRAILGRPPGRRGKWILSNSVDADSRVASANVEPYRTSLDSGTVKHLIAVPLGTELGPLGVLRVVNKMEEGGLSRTGFTEEDAQFLSIIATLLSLGLEKQRLFDEETARRQMAEQLVAAASAVTASLELTDLFEQILDQLRQVVPYSTASVQVLERDGFHIVGCRGFRDVDAVQRLVFPLEPQFPNSRILYRRKPLILGDVPGDYESFADPRWHAQHIRSWLGVPMVYRDRVVGLIALDSTTPNFYTTSHAAAASAFATQAAIALTNARLFADTQREAQRKDLMIELAGLLGRLTTTERLPDALVNSAVRLFENAKGVVVHYLDPASRSLVPAAAWPAQGTRTGRSALALGEGIAGIALQSRTTIVVADAWADERFKGTPPENVRSLAVAPLCVGEAKLIGTISVYSGQVAVFGHTDSEALTMLASLAASSWANLELWQAREARRQQVERLLQDAHTFDMSIGLHELCRRIAQVAVNTHGWGWAALTVKASNPSESSKPIRAAFSSVADPAFHQATFHSTEVLRRMLEKGIPLGRCLWVRGAYTVVLGEDAVGDTADDDFQGHPAAWSRGDALIAPLEASDIGNIGYLAVADPRRRVLPSADEIQLLELLCNQAAAAIHRALLYQETEERIAKEERSRLESELHEAMNVLQTGVRWEVETTRAALSEERMDDVTYGLDRIEASSGRAYDDLKYILRDLGDPILEQQGLLPALLDYASEVWQGKVVVAPGKDSFGRLPSGVEHTLYRIAQEGVTNALKHAGLDKTGAFPVTVELSRSDGRTTLTVRDAGKGFDVEAAKEGKGLSGIKRMYAWAASEGIDLDIQSQPGKGTTLVARVVVD